MHYKLDELVTVEGVVTEFLLVNPHARIYFDVTTPAGDTKTWMAEGDPASVLRRRDWTDESLRRGDFVKVTGNPSKDGRDLVEWRTIILSDGRELGGGNGQNDERDAFFQQRLRNESVAPIDFSTSASARDVRRPGLEGIWIEGYSAYTDPGWRLQDLVCLRCSRAAFEYLDTLMEQDEQRSLTDYTKATEEFDKEYIWGLLTDAGREHHLEVASPPDPGCESIGLLQLLTGALSVRIEEYENRITFQYEYLGPTRTVYMDARDHPAGLKKSLLGHSIGRYEGATLVVETTGLEPSIVRSSSYDSHKD